MPSLPESQQGQSPLATEAYKSNAGMSDDLRIKEFPWEEPKKKGLPKQFAYLGQE